MSQPETIQQKIVTCDDTECMLVAEHFFAYFADEDNINKFDHVLLDIARIYPSAVLIGAIATSKYIQPPVEPRVTFDIDLILEESDFNDFIDDDIPAEKNALLETYFQTSDSLSHSLQHRRTRIYVDFLSLESQPIRKRIVRHILENREDATNILTLGDHQIQIVKPELLLAMKINRYAKNPKSEKGITDHLDVVKILKSFHNQIDMLDADRVKSFLNRREVKLFDDICCDADEEMCAWSAASAGAMY